MTEKKLKTNIRKIETALQKVHPDNGIAYSMRTQYRHLKTLLNNG